MNKTLIIAEIGVNHNGCLETAKKMIDKQNFQALIMLNFKVLLHHRLLQKNALKSDYQKLLKMIKALN